MPCHFEALSYGLSYFWSHESCRNRERILTYRRHNFFLKKGLQSKPLFYSIKQEGRVRIPPSPLLQRGTLKVLGLQGLVMFSRFLTGLLPSNVECSWCRVVCCLYYEVLSFRTHSALLRAGFDAESRPYDKSGFPLLRLCSGQVSRE